MAPHVMGAARGGESFFLISLVSSFGVIILNLLNYKWQNKPNLGDSPVSRIQVQVINELYIKERMRSPEGRAMLPVRPNTCISSITIDLHYNNFEP